MPITKKDFGSLQSGVNQLYGAQADAYKQEQEAALRKYLQAQEPSIEGAKQSARNRENLDTLANPQLRKFLQPGGSVSVGDIKVGQEPKSALSFQLTPAQEAAEKVGGKEIAEFEGGGKQAAESNISQIQGVQSELEKGKKDAYDRYVGGALENHPTLMGIFNPAEKARRDAVQNAMLSMLHDAGIPRPTQWDIQRVFGQVYDPAADDKSNIQRLTQAMTKISGHSKAMQDQADRYHATGYATIGAPAKASAKPQGFDPDAFLKGQ